MDLVGSRQISRCEASSFTCGIHHMEIPLGVFTSLTLLLTALGDLQEMTIGIAQECAHLIAPVNRRCEESSSGRPQHLRADEATGHRDRHPAASCCRNHGCGKVLRGMISDWTPPNL